ncbi:hypothetical protein WBJ53_05435 [Spirosoma sp. SC4-14]|uniref:hypothetical protein n=1 Tax=Spirosoma sp. SC4-14 TaxID=3128900 RepID=UPI0030CA96F2
MDANTEIQESIAYLTRNQYNIEKAKGINKAFEKIVVHLKEYFDDEDVLFMLSELSDDIKILIIQQFFQHTQKGSHQTEFDYNKVSALLNKWFNIKIDLHWEQSKIQTKNNIKTISSKADNQGISKIDFGETKIFFVTNGTHRLAVKELLNTISQNTIITTDRTSPPCAIAEFIPLWLKDRSLNVSEYYIDGSNHHQIEQYFSIIERSLSENIGISFHEVSTEMGIITNGDALRFHKDRLVNQYAFLDKLGANRNSFSVSQCLTLIDWDMQENTMSGIIFDHPNGDRYIFCLFPGETISLLFAENVKPIGPMMMPYHCALPVIDNSARNTIGIAKGKRLSTVLRGLVNLESLAKLTEKSSNIPINELSIENGNSRIYRDGTKIFHNKVQDIENSQGCLVDDQGEEITIIELSIQGNEKFLYELLGGDLSNTKLYRLEKRSSGFSDLNIAIPDFTTADQIHIINRSKNCPQNNFNYPIAFDFNEHQLPWIQLFPVSVSESIEIPKNMRHLVRLCPPSEVLHRSAIADSFYQFSTLKRRQSIIVDIVLR